MRESKSLLPFPLPFLLLQKHRLYSGSLGQVFELAVIIICTELRAHDSPCTVVYSNEHIGTTSLPSSGRLAGELQHILLSE